MGSYASQGHGLYATAESHRFWADRLYKPDGSKRVVVFCHGAGSDYRIGPQEGAFVLKGLPIIATDLGGEQTWGDDTSVEDRIDQAWAYAQSAFGVAGDKLILWGGSMGSIPALLYLLEHPENVAACGIALPICDPEQVRAGPADPAHRAEGQSSGGATTPSYTTQIQAVHGSPVPDAKRPFVRVDEYDPDVPVKLFTSETDTVGAAGIAHDFADAHPNAEGVSLGNAGHSYLSMDNDEAFGFLVEHMRP